MGSHRERRVAVADDDAAFRALVREVLERAPGFSVVAEARNGAEAVVTALSERPDVVLMDLDMPVLDGVAAAAAIRASAVDVRVVAITGTQDPAQLEAFRAVGVRDIVKKPFDPEVLLAVLQASG